MSCAILENMDYTKTLDWLKKNLNEERFSHSLGTADCARRLAGIHGVDEEKAYLAGLLHDCAKCFSKEQLKEIIDEHLTLDENELINPKTYHAPVSAHIAEKELGVCDDEILSAIKCHTLGKVDMSTFEKIIFLADKIESNTREKDFCKQIEKILDEHGLDKALLECYCATIKSLVERGLKICPCTVDIYNKLQD